MLTQKLKRNNCRICSTKPAIHERAEPTGFLNLLLLASKLVSMGRASLKESSATKNVKNKGWNRQEMTIEKDEILLKASPADLLKSIKVTSRSLSAAALFPFVKFSSSDQKAIARNTPKRHRSNLSKRRRSDTPTDNSSRQQNDQKLVTTLSPKQSICWSREITQNVDASTNPNDVTSQHYSICAPAGQQQPSQRKTTASRKEYVTPTPSYLLTALATDSSNHLLIVLH
ncbi:hypothetical protein F511_43403 [Dorcoceras hygrometricum]|uniref:Uncharacterized protein n=1 Tax=Dorcoceras hygrometricum TaxID=472368 RepID=A0A2Z7CB19_9LAMI|nr:hypothetical protein F511_43403 [Dorcoceras hygrometricum]